MNLSVRQENEASVIAIQGDIDLKHSPDVRRAILESIGQAPGANVILDLRAVRYIDSSGVATLVEGYRKTRELNGRFILVGVSKAARELLELTKLVTLFEIYQDAEHALAAVRGIHSRT
jgi:anti-sigma B factor antagonist